MGTPHPQKPENPLLGPPRAPGGPRKPPGSPQGPYGPIRIHTDPYGHLSGQFSIYIFLQHFPKMVKMRQHIFWKLIWEGSVWILMDPYGPVWVRMVPEDSLGASWGLLGPWGPPKGGFQVFGGGVGPGGPCCGSVSGCLGFLLAYHRNPYASAAGCCGLDHGWLPYILLA